METESKREAEAAPVVVAEKAARKAAKSVRQKGTPLKKPQDHVPGDPYPVEYKKKVLALMNKSKTIQEVANQTGLSRTVLTAWRKEDARGTPLVAKTKNSPRSRYTEDFKRKSVARYPAESTNDIIKDLKISRSMLSRWRKQYGSAATYRKKHTDAFKSNAVMRVLRGETNGKVSSELGINTGLLSTWVKNYQATDQQRLARKKNYYVPVAKRNMEADVEAKGASELKRSVMSSIQLLRGIRPKCNNSDPIHLTAMLVLATLEGKM